MTSAYRLLDLEWMHPQLWWDEIAIAAVAVLGRETQGHSVAVELETVDVPGFGTKHGILLIETTGFPQELLVRIEKTYEWPRLVELAAIAVTGLALYHSGGHEIVDVAVRGSGADYLTDDAQYPLEVAGRSRRSDFEIAWRQRSERLKRRLVGGGYVSVVEFQTPTARLGFLTG